MSSAHESLKCFPPVELTSDKGIVGFSERDKELIMSRTELRFVDAGGLAGGIKARHRRLGLFLKFAFDQPTAHGNEIYGSMAMAAKAAKREAAASEWLHALDSVHVSTPLLKCVDLPVSLQSGKNRVIRVQVYAYVNLRGCCKPDSDDFDRQMQETTLRVGSSDAQRSIHIDRQQEEQVLLPVARHFYLAPNRRAYKVLVEHTYIEPTDSSTEDVLDYMLSHGFTRADVKLIHSGLGSPSATVSSSPVVRRTGSNWSARSVSLAAASGAGADLAAPSPRHASSEGASDLRAANQDYSTTNQDESEPAIENCLGDVVIQQVSKVVLPSCKHVRSTHRASKRIHSQTDDYVDL